MNNPQIANNSQYKILLVEDEESVAKLMLYNIKKAGYKHEWAENGLEGYLLAKSFKPDLILSDIMMPEVDGYQFRKQLLEDDQLKNIPFVFLTAKGNEDDILQGYDLNIEDYIVKTSGAKVILAKVSALLKSKQKEKEQAVNEVHQAANSMGTKVVPDEAPNFEGYKIQHWHVPFQNVPGGDFIDYYQVDDDNLIVVLGDIMGKKWGAWYFAVAYAGYVRSAIRIILDSKEELSPATLLNRVNRAINKDERISDVFITLSILNINKSTKTIQYSGAGDLPVIYKSNETKSIKSNGILIGFKEVGNYENIEIKLNAGDSVYVFTDGIPETRCTDGEFYGEGRLKEQISKLSPSDNPLENIINDFTASTNNKFEDDISIIAIKAK